MLYVSTRDSHAIYTAQQTMFRLNADDGGLFVPLRLPEYGLDELAQLLKLSFWNCVCQVLNRFFPVRLCPESFGEGELPVPEAFSIRHKILVVPLWDRLTGQFRGMQNRILTAMGSAVAGAQSWPEMAVDVALLFGVYGLLCHCGMIFQGDPVNLAVSAAGFQLPVAAVYARQMGIPIGVCVCVGNENSMLWDLLHRGEAKLDSQSEGDGSAGQERGAPRNLERLVCTRLGPELTGEYVRTLQRRGLYTLEPKNHLQLRQGLSVSMVGGQRALSMIPRIYRNADCLFSPHSAMIYSGLMDYRATGGEGSTTVLLAEESPLRWGECVLKAMRIPVESVTGQISALEARAAERRKGS